MKIRVKHFILLLGSIFFAACTSNTILKKPDNLIPKDQMVDVLTDMLLANGGKTIKNLNLERNVNYYPLVFEKHQIDSTRFSISNHYYISRIDDYNDILLKVNERLNLKKEKLQQIVKVEDSIQKVQDSIKREKTKLVRDSIKKAKIQLSRDSVKKEILIKNKRPKLVK